MGVIHHKIEHLRIDKPLSSCSTILKIIISQFHIWEGEAAELRLDGWASGRQPWTGHAFKGVSRNLRAFYCLA